VKGRKGGRLRGSPRRRTDHLPGSGHPIFAGRHIATSGTGSGAACSALLAGIPWLIVHLTRKWASENKLPGHHFDPNF